MIFRNGWWLLRETVKEWSADKAPRLGAALSYYTVFSLAPVLILAIAVAALFLGAEAAQGKVVEQLRGLLGHDAASVVQTMLKNAGRHDGGVLATVIGAGTLLIGATGVMVELQGALNTVWKVVPKPGQAVKTLVRSRLIALALVLSMGFLLLVSLVLSTALAALSGWLGELMPASAVLGFLLNEGVSILVVALFFAIIFRVLPDAKIAWHDVWIGSLVTSLLFHLGKFLIGLYLARASVASTFGAAGSLAVLLVWVYYSSQIVLLGAEFTRVYANRFGSHVVPEEHAVEAAHGAEERLAQERALVHQHKARSGSEKDRRAHH
jgi:membrane protein